MNYLTLESIKKQCRIDLDDHEEDDLLEAYGEAAEEMVKNTTHQSIEQMYDEYGDIPKSCIVAALMFAAELYKNREATSNITITPNKSMMALLAPYIYSYHCE